MVAIGTQAAVAAAILNGAHIVRVHDVAHTVATCTVVDAILNS
jgi:dihydropteroate synthase